MTIALLLYGVMALAVIWWLALALPRLDAPKEEMKMSLPSTPNMDALTPKQQMIAARILKFLLVCEIGASPDSIAALRAVALDCEAALTKMGLMKQPVIPTSMVSDAEAEALRAELNKPKES